MTNFKKRALSLLTTVCMLAGAMSVMSITASAASGRVPQDGKGYMIQLNHGLYLTTDGTNVYAAPRHYNNSDQFFIYRKGGNTSTSVRLESSKYAGKFVTTYSSPYLTKLNIFLEEGGNSPFQNTDEDPRYITYNEGTWNGSSAATAPGNVYACPSQQLDSVTGYHFQFVFPGDVPPAESAFHTGLCTIRNQNGQYLNLSMDSVEAGTGVVASDKPMTWNVVETANGFRLSPVDSDLYVVSNGIGNQVSLGSDPSFELSAGRYDNEHYVFYTPMKSENDSEKYLRIADNGDVVMSRGMDAATSTWATIPV